MRYLIPFLMMFQELPKHLQPDLSARVAAASPYLALGNLSMRQVHKKEYETVCK